MRVGIALGSNLGDSVKNIRVACEYLKGLHNGSGPFLQSTLHSTSPIDCPAGSPSFINAAVELGTDLPPFDLLDLLQAYEVDHGRPSGHGFHTPRTIDLDLLYCDQLVLRHPRLTIPHPLLASRLFVLAPLAEICPHRRIPISSRTIRELCDALS